MSVVPSLGLKTPRNTLMAICLSVSDQGRIRETLLALTAHQTLFPPHTIPSPQPSLLPPSTTPTCESIAIIPLYCLQ